MILLRTKCVTAFRYCNTIKLKRVNTKILASLTPREERVLRMRFGIGMNTDHTLEEVGFNFQSQEKESDKSRQKL